MSNHIGIKAKAIAHEALDSPIRYILSDGSVAAAEDRMLALLLLDDQVFVNTRSYVEEGSTEPQGPTIVCFVVCNDIFAWACADAEHLTTVDIPEIYDMWERDPVWGTAKWCCRKRNEKPQGPVVEAMKKAGVWEAWMDELDVNHYDRDKPW